MKIAMLVSGGVDSSVALRLLVDQGHDVTAFYLKIWLEDELAYLGDCPWEQDLSYVRKVCKQANVRLEVISLQKEYFDHVVSYAIKEIKAGRTPNPDIFCNQKVKFGFFFDKISKDFDKVATGHYAQVKEKDGVFQLVSAPDEVKDQTYFLSYLSQKQLSRLLFPIGSFVKSKVRELAHQYDLPNKDRKDSQGICFLGKLKFSDFVKHYCGKKEGDLVEQETGNVVGKHNGFWFYTIGQRQGIGLSGGPWYVVQKDVNKNIVYISRNYYQTNKVRDTFEVEDINWFSGFMPKEKVLDVKLRHGKHRYQCFVQKLSNNLVRVKLNESDQGIAPGQFAVFYKGAVCLGGGIIKQSL